MKQILHSIPGLVWALVLVLIVICVWWTIRFYTGMPPIPGVEAIIKKVFGIE